MLAELIGFKDNQNNDWPENFLNRVASNTIRHLFTQSKSVEVKVRCYPSSKLLQGTIDSFQMKGEGLVIRRDFRVEEMSFETDGVFLDFSSVLQGKISLKQATMAIAKIKLSETDLNLAFKAELVKKRLENLTLPNLEELSGSLTISFSDINLKLLPHNQIKLSATANLKDKQIPLALQSGLEVVHRQKIKFNNLKFNPEIIPSEHREISQKLTEILGELLNEMVDLERFNLDGVSLRLNRLETTNDFLIFSGVAKISHFPRQG
jgi:hypothetical protein